MTKDIQHANDIKLLLDAFYEKVKVDDTIAYIFNDVANLNWDEHMPKIYAFWESILLGKPGFSGDVMGAHVRLNQKEKLTSTHFDRWLELFEESVQEMYSGNVASEAINRAKNIRRNMEYHLFNSK